MPQAFYAIDKTKTLAFSLDINFDTDNKLDYNKKKNLGIVWGELNWQNIEFDCKSVIIKNAKIFIAVLYCKILRALIRKY